MYNPEKPYKHTIIKLIKSTWGTPYVKVTPGLYPIIKKRFSLSEIQHTDGIGTKGLYHWENRTFKNAVIDSMAMNLNDLAMVGAIPYAIQNHIVLPKDDHRAILDIVKALVKECRKRKIAMTGGETSIHEGYPGLDISITVSGFLRKTRTNKCRVGDILIGIRSSGIHSNGITKARYVLKGKCKKELSKPTEIYLEQILSLIEKCKVNGMMHITGGAFTKLKDILGHADATIFQPQKLRPQNIFYEIYKKGISDKTMYSTFNCGIGFILSVPKKESEKIVSSLSGSAIIGKITSGTGNINIVSAFSERAFKL